MESGNLNTFRLIKTSEFHPHYDLRLYIRKYVFRINTRKILHNILIAPLQNGYYEIYLHYNNSEVVAHFLFGDEKCSNTVVGFFSPGLNPVIRPIVYEDTAKWASITLTFAGLKRLLAIQGRELFNKVIHLHDVFGYPAKQLQQHLYYAPDDYKRKRILDRFFLKRLTNCTLQKESKLILLDNYLSRVKGKVTVKSMASRVCMSYRSLERLFNDDVGINFRDYLKMHRLNKAMKLMSDKNKVEYSSIIYLYGYYDQSHFIKEFSNLTGYTPKHFLELSKGSFYLDRAYIIRDKRFYAIPETDSVNLA